MSNIAIDQNIPRPLSRARRVRAEAYPLNDLAVGDSFFCVESGSKMSGTFSRYLSKKFSVRSVTENGISGVRVWRLE